MRVDKYLWCVRYYKTRSLASDACKKNHVTVNGQVAKSSKEVYPTDKIKEVYEVLVKAESEWIDIITKDINEEDLEKSYLYAGTVF